MDLELIRRALEQPGKSRKGLAQAMGRQPSMVTDMLNGRRQIKASELPVIAKYLDLDMAMYIEEPKAVPEVDSALIPGIMAARGWTLPRLAFELRATEPTVLSWLKGIRPSADHRHQLIEMAEEFGLTPRPQPPGRPSLDAIAADADDETYEFIVDLVRRLVRDTKT